MRIRRKRSDPRDEIVVSEFLRGRWLWMLIGAGAGVIVAAAVGIYVVLSVFGTVSPAESADQEARELCQAEISQQLDGGTIQFTNESTEELGDNTWNVRGRAELGWSDWHEYTCTYKAGELVTTKIIQ